MPKADIIEVLEIIEVLVAEIIEALCALSLLKITDVAECKWQCFDCDSVIRGHHIYKKVWEASHSEMLNCIWESGNSFDPFAVAVVRGGKIICHMSKA